MNWDRKHRYAIYQKLPQICKILHTVTVTVDNQISYAKTENTVFQEHERGDLKVALGWPSVRNQRFVLDKMRKKRDMWRKDARMMRVWKI